MSFAAGFADAMIASFPEGLAPPEPLVRFFRWQEEQGLARQGSGAPYALIDADFEQCCMFSRPADPDHVPSWLPDADEAERARLYPFFRTGGDGSYAALWRDDAGELRIVHMGSGSGSVMFCVLVDNAIDFLRLIAIGYDEVCWPENFDRSPAEVHADEWPDEDEDDDAPKLGNPAALRTWVESSFGVTIPATASEIVDMDVVTAQYPESDPFAQWLQRLQDGA